jgi:hypothetical protein
MRRSGMSGVCFRPITDTSAVSEFSCVWLADSEDPARDLFIKGIPGLAQD